jgi:membrane protein implicated in regulation of membrane protease activity
MDPPMLTPASSFRRIVLKSALLNAVIVLTSFPVLVLAGGPRAVALTLAIMAGITVLVWTATFILFSCVSIVRLLLAPSSSRTRRKPQDRAKKLGVADRWLDGPV